MKMNSPRPPAPRGSKPKPAVKQQYSQQRSPKLLRINKFIAQTGVASRRKAEELISSGRVQVNGKTVYELGVSIQPATDKVTVDHKPVRIQTDHLYVAFYKPEKVLTTLKDPEGRPCLTDFLPEKLKTRLFPVGRLDWDSEGLLLLTNDGDLAQQVAHPKTGIPKTYLVKLNGHLKSEHIRKLLNGVSIIGGKAKALSVTQVARGDSKKYDWVRVVIDEGRNRQIRQMMAKVGFDVKRLRRTAIGRLALGTMEKGQFQLLGPMDLKKIFESPLNLRDKKPRAKSTKK